MEGALARLDLWPVPADVPADVDMDAWPPAISKKDATAFVRAVRRFGVVQRLDAIVRECGTCEWVPVPQGSSRVRCLYNIIDTHASRHTLYQ